MPVIAKLIAFVAGLAVIGGVAAAAGDMTKTTPPLRAGPSRAEDAGGHGQHGGATPTTPGNRGTMAMSGSHRGMTMPGSGPGGDGTLLTADGVTLAPAFDRIAAGHRRTWRFRVLDRRGVPVRAFERDQTKLLHLIVARADLTGYQHLHPALGPDGTFSIALRLGQPGRYRAIADFTTGKRRHVLGTTLTVPGDAAAQALPAPASRADADGYEVSLAQSPALVAGVEARLTFVVRRDGRPVTDLQPYLGARGHLVALRAGDLAYSHVHPTGAEAGAGAITFGIEPPAAGAYRLFLQFRAGGRVHSVAFTRVAHLPPVPDTKRSLP